MKNEEYSGKLWYINDMLSISLLILNSKAYCINIGKGRNRQVEAKETSKVIELGERGCSHTDTPNYKSSFETRHSQTPFL